MIIEWLTSKLTPASTVARAVGYVDSSIALAHRYKRCRKAWQPHVEACHQIILSEQPANAKKVLIVGSGPLLEVPLDQLLQADQHVHVTLVDIVHPIGVRRKIKKYKDRVKLIEMDVTGSAKLMLSVEGLKKISQFDFAPPQAAADSALASDYDYVVSANIISQLSLDPYNRLVKSQSPLVSDKFFSQLSQHMGDQHLEWLTKLGRKVLLIADMKRTYFDKLGQEMEQVESAYVTRAGKLIKNWDWLISPLGETAKNFSYSMQVEARILKNE